MRVAAPSSPPFFFLSLDLYPRRETPVEVDANWRASLALAKRCGVPEPEPHADIVCSEGNFQAYVEDLRKRKGPDADQPHRVQYRKLVRA